VGWLGIDVGEIQFRLRGNDPRIRRRTCTHDHLSRDRCSKPERIRWLCSWNEAKYSEMLGHGEKTLAKRGYLVSVLRASRLLTEENDEQVAAFPPGYPPRPLQQLSFANCDG
jgi:hypothetical protein